ncbi:hypothetical protein BGX26_001762 [Mortierella sp. AD094]|nr:hypothetical protein BGX26_001762 [Mortierella sp. AD094]
MNDPSRQPISQSTGLETRTKLDARLAQESTGKEDNTVHGIPPFTVPRADGTLEASPDTYAHVPQTATVRMRRRQGEMSQSDQDGDGSHTNFQGYRDAGSGDDNINSSSTYSGKQGNSSPMRNPIGSLKSGSITRRSLLQRLRKAVFPTLIGIVVGWYYDAIGILIYRNDPRIKGTLLTFSLVCWLTMLSIFFYLEFIRPITHKKPTQYVNWENELLYPIRIATATLVMGIVGANVALWPVWHISTFFVLTALAVAIINVLGIFF